VDYFKVRSRHSSVDTEEDYGQNESHSRHWTTFVCRLIHRHLECNENLPTVCQGDGLAKADQQCGPLGLRI
jgi:hypothetical protein